MNRDAISIHLAVQFAWTVYKKRYGLFLAILLTLFGAWIVLEIAVIAGQPLGILWWIAAHLAFFVVFAGLKAGLLRICLALYDGIDPTFTDVFKYLKQGPIFFAGQLVYLLIVAVGLIFLVIPGLYLAARYALFGFCLIDSDTTNRARSFQQSATLSTSIKMSLMLILIGLILFNVLGAALLGLGLLVTLPVSSLIMAAIYRQASDLKVIS